MLTTELEYGCFKGIRNGNISLLEFILNVIFCMNHLSVLGSTHWDLEDSIEIGFDYII